MCSPGQKRVFYHLHQCVDTCPFNFEIMLVYQGMADIGPVCVFKFENAVLPNCAFSTTDFSKGKQICKKCNNGHIKLMDYTKQEFYSGDCVTKAECLLRKFHYISDLGFCVVDLCKTFSPLGPCVECIDEFYITSDALCLPCKDLFPNSKTCSKNRINMCITNYYLYDRDNNGLYDSCISCSTDRCEDDSLIYSIELNTGEGLEEIKYCFNVKSLVETSVIKI